MEERRNKSGFLFFPSNCGEGGLGKRKLDASRMKVVEVVERREKKRRRLGFLIAQNSIFDIETLLKLLHRLPFFSFFSPF